MTVASADLPLGGSPGRPPGGAYQREALLAELREVDHWRRLVAARLDLAVAAVTDIDELAGPEPTPPAPASPMACPSGLRALVGIPSSEQALPETGLLLRLRQVLRDLDAYAKVLRTAPSRVDIGPHLPR